MHQGQKVWPLSFAFLHVVGSSNSLATRDPPDVCSLSCRVTLKPVSPPLQQGVRFFRHPHPYHYQYPLRCTFPKRERYEVPTFRNEKCAGLGACYRPGSLVATETHVIIVSPTSSTVWFKRDNHFRLFRFTVFIAGSDTFTRYLHPTGYLALTRLWLPGEYASHDLYPSQYSATRYIVGTALYSCPWIHLAAQMVSSPKVETTSQCDFVSHITESGV